MADRFDQFTERARRALTSAQEEAQRFHHNYIGTEHLLLGLVREGEGVAATVLANLGVELDKVRSGVELIIGRGERMVPGEVGLTPRAKNVIALAWAEMEGLGHEYLGTEHLLLGLVREGEGIAAGVLESLGVNLPRVRAETLRVLGQPPDPGQASRPAQGRAPGSAAGRRFDKFTERARRVINSAQEEAQRFHHNYISPEHLLLALVRESEGVAARVLTSLGVEADKVRSAVEFIIGQGAQQAEGQIGLTSHAKRVIELAVDEARQMNHHYIGTEHLLLGLVREGEGIAAGVLESFGVRLDAARSETSRVLSQAQPPSPRETASPPGPGVPAQPTRQNFDRFSEQARQILTLAQEEAERLGRAAVDAEHLLLGLTRLREGLAVQIFQGLGIALDRVRAAVEARLGSGPSHGSSGLSPRAKIVIELAIDTARQYGQAQIDSEHLLLGLIREGRSIAAEVLAGLGVSQERVRRELGRLLGRVDLPPLPEEGAPQPLTVSFPRRTSQPRDFLDYQVQIDFLPALLLQIVAAQPRTEEEVLAAVERYGRFQLASGGDNPSTVLKALQRGEWIEQVSEPPGPARYQITDRGEMELGLLKPDIQRRLHDALETFQQLDRLFFPEAPEPQGEPDDA